MLVDVEMGVNGVKLYKNCKGEPSHCGQTHRDCVLFVSLLLLFIYREIFLNITFISIVYISSYKRHTKNSIY